MIRRLLEAMIRMRGRRIAREVTAATTITCRHYQRESPDNASCYVCGGTAFDHPCRCAEIQARDPLRHFKGCPKRLDLPGVCDPLYLAAAELRAARDGLQAALEAQPFDHHASQLAEVAVRGAQARLLDAALLPTPVPDDAGQRWANAMVDRVQAARRELAAAHDIFFAFYMGGDDLDEEHFGEVLARARLSLQLAIGVARAREALIEVSQRKPGGT